MSPLVNIHEPDGMLLMGFSPHVNLEKSPLNISGVGKERSSDLGSVRQSQLATSPSHLEVFDDQHLKSASVSN